jgi:dolichyl-diphosphooligosaccharide--protein glycosyltransferase
LGSNPPTNWIKIFEYVPGALIKVSAAPNQKVGALLNMTSNQGRAFQYVNEGIQNGNGYEIRVPYSTEKKYDTHAVAPYQVYASNSSADIKIKNINVTEDDVLKGRVLEVNL